MATTSKMVAAARAKALLDDELVVFDTETTGFHSTDEIIQIAAINVHGETLLNTYLRPQQPILNTQYHGITDEMVKGAPTFDHVYPSILSAFEGKTVVAYNYDYDSRMLKQCCDRYQCERFPLRFDCAMELYSAFYGEWDSYHGNYRWQKLRAAVKRFDLEFDGEEHNALADCKATLAVLKKMAEWHDTQQTP